MQCPENPFSKMLTDARYAREFLDARFADPLHASKMRQERTPSTGADARNFFQSRFDRGLLAPAAVPGDGEPVRFVPYLLNQV